MSYKKKNTERNQTTHYPSRTLTGHQKLAHWQRNKTLCPEIVDNPPSDCDSPCECKIHTSYAKPKVKSASRNNNAPVAPPTYKTTTSKYHTRCLPSTPKSNIKRIPAPKPYIISNVMYAEFLGPDTDYNCSYPAPSPPLLPCQPLQSPCNKTTKNRYKSPNKESVSLYNLDTLRKAKALLDYSPESEFLKRLKKEADETFHCQCVECKLENEISKLQLTGNRRLLEEYYDGSKTNNLNELFGEAPMCCKYAQLTFPDYKFKPSRFGGVDQELQKYSIKKPNPKITKCSPEVKNSKPEIKKSDSNNHNLPEQHPLDASPNSVCVDDSLTDELKKFNRLIRSKAIHITPRKINFPSRSVLKQLINIPDLNAKSKIDKKKTVAANNS